LFGAQILGHFNGYIWALILENYNGYIGATILNPCNGYVEDLIADHQNGSIGPSILEKTGKVEYVPEHIHAFFANGELLLNNYISYLA
jgi:hypothetical protein